MQSPIMLAPQRIAADTYTLLAYLPVPGAGLLPVNAFLIRAAQPMLIDTGLAALGADFIDRLSQLIDPADLAWIYLTHTDPDHLGNLAELMALAPRAHLVTTFLGMGKLGLLQFPLNRVYLLNPGQRLDLGDRTVLALRPPVFDAPETTGLFDPDNRILFSSDCFGALMQQPAETAQSIHPDALRDGLINWTMVDAPWLPLVEASALNRAIAPLRQLQPQVILSSHLPPAWGMTDRLIDYLQLARLATPTPGPDQQALEQMMAIAA
ncbi:MAG TPA: MBL fold metallo-hydrolase [Nodosilinea sp.]|nr:MBL fold metallo-hydrolase [Nodosilinea sp.]